MKSKRKHGNALIITGLLLIAAALFLTGYNLYDSSRADKEAMTVLDELKPMIDEIAPGAGTSDPASDPYEGAGAADPASGNGGQNGIPDYKLDPNMEMPVRMIRGHDYIGILTIPDIGAQLPVMSSWSYKNLKTAPCRYSGSAYQNDLIICAHNYTKHFGRLKYLSPGAPVIFTDMDGNVFYYEVAGIEVLKPRAIEAMESGDWDLTLFTCTVGGATRVTVRCELAG